MPIAAFHRLVPFSVAGFGLNAASGSMFLMTEPNQYIYNPAFHFKLLFLTLAGVNIVVFYALFFRRVRTLGAGTRPPAGLKVIGAVSLACWAAVIICGRLITFYRPTGCFPDEVVGFFTDKADAVFACEMFKMRDAGTLTICGDPLAHTRAGGETETGE